MRERNPIEPVSLVLVAGVGVGTFWVAGSGGDLPPQFQKMWNTWFNKGKMPSKNTLVKTPTGQTVQQAGKSKPATVIPQSATPPSVNITLPSIQLPNIPGLPLGLISVIPHINISGWPGSNDREVFECWADKFQYVYGDSVTFYGRLVVIAPPASEGGSVRVIGVGGAPIDIIDPDAPDGPQRFISTNTDNDGNWSATWSYNGETSHWRAYAYFPGFDWSRIGDGIQAFWQGYLQELGARQTGILDFYPIESDVTASPDV